MNNNNRDIRNKTAAPIGVLLKDRSKESIKKSMGHEVPLMFQYTNEDIKILRLMLDDLDWHGIKDTKQMTILRNLYKATLEDDPHETFKFMHSKKWGKVSKHAYEVMYTTPKEDLPLKINETLTYLLVKWRLTINK